MKNKQAEKLKNLKIYTWKLLNGRKDNGEDGGKVSGEDGGKKVWWNDWF